jgi:hypothetical protein
MDAAINKSPPTRCMDLIFHQGIFKEILGNHTTVRHEGHYIIQ